MPIVHAHCPSRHVEYVTIGSRWIDHRSNQHVGLRVLWFNLEHLIAISALYRIQNLFYYHHHHDNNTTYIHRSKDRSFIRSPFQPFHQALQRKWTNLLGNGLVQCLSRTSLRRFFHSQKRSWFRNQILTIKYLPKLETRRKKQICATPM